MNFRATLLALQLALVSAPVLTAGTGGGSSTGPLESLADREITRRQEDVVLAQEALQASEAQLRQNNIEAAYESAKRAADLVPDGSTARGLRSRAISRFSSLSVRYAEYLVSQGEYARAATVAREVLEPRYNPGYRPAAVFLDRLDQPDYFNKTITPEFAAEQSEVERLLNEATGFYDSGRFDLAQKRYRQVLAVDKYNAAAFRGMEQVELGKQRYYESAYNETRSRMLWQVEKSWERPHAQDVQEGAGQFVEPESTGAGTEKTIAMLNRLVIPRVDLKDASLQTAVDFLRAQSKRLVAQDQGGDGEGLNVVLKVPPTPTAAPAPEFGDEGAAPVQPSAAFNNRITLSLTDVPLYEAFRYVALLAGLNLKIEPYAVTIGTETENMETRVFKNVPPNFFADSGEPSAATDSPAYPGAAAPAEGTSLRGRPAVDAKKFLEEQRRVTFDSGSSASYNPRTGLLRVVNTPANLDLIEAQIEAAAATGPQQVRIETKFVEISQNNLKELGFDWTVGPFSIGGTGVYGGGGNSMSGGRTLPFVNPATGEIVGTDTLTGGLRTGSGAAPYSAISVNSLNALLARNLGLGGSAPAPGIFSLAGVFTNPQFQVLIRALNQQKAVDLMAAPSVTTQSGKEAVITLTRIFPYPTEFTPPEIPQSTGGSTANIFGIVQEQDPVVTPTFPTAFTTRDLGVTLKVKPVIGPDGYTIDLDLSPEVVDFDGFINYGSPIYAPQRTQSIEGEALGLVGLAPLFRQQLLTENVINQPIFSKRKVESSVAVWDGQTVVLGGLIREDVQKVDDKVPFLGDIPLAGALFRSEVDQKIKRNLIIFCTPRIVDAAGQYRRPEEDISDDQEIVEPLGLPAELPTPGTTMSAKGYRQK
jgi:general secretion pathway protein D